MGFGISLCSWCKEVHQLLKAIAQGLDIEFARSKSTLPPEIVTATASLSPLRFTPPFSSLLPELSPSDVSQRLRFSPFQPWIILASLRLLTLDLLNQPMPLRQLAPTQLVI